MYFVISLKEIFLFLRLTRYFPELLLINYMSKISKVIKGISGATSVINKEDESALNYCALSVPKLVEIISQFENEYKQNDQSLPSIKDHHECSKAF